MWSEKKGPACKTRTHFSEYRMVDSGGMHSLVLPGILEKTQVFKANGHQRILTMPKQGVSGDYK